MCENNKCVVDLARGETKAVYVDQMQNYSRMLVGGAAVYKNKTQYDKTIQICPLCTSYDRLTVDQAICICPAFDLDRNILSNGIASERRVQMLQNVSRCL